MGGTLLKNLTVQKWLLSIGFIAALSPIVLGALLLEDAMPYFYGALSVVTVVSFVISGLLQSKTEKRSARSATISEFVMLLPGVHLAAGLVTCTPEVPWIQGISGASILVFFLLFLLMTQKYVELMLTHKSPGL